MTVQLLETACINFCLIIHLVVSSWVSEDKKARLAEGCLQLIGEGPGSVSPCNRMSACVLCKLQDSPLTIRPSRLNNDVLWVFNCHNNSGS